MLSGRTRVQIRTVADGGRPRCGGDGDRDRVRSRPRPRAMSRCSIRRMRQPISGSTARASRMATEGLERALANDDTFNAHSVCRAVLGFLALSVSDHQRAYGHLQPVVRYLALMSPAEPAVIPCIPDEIETLVALGLLDEADETLAGLTTRARFSDRPWALATAARCRGLIAGARGDPAGALRALDDAIVAHDRLAQPFEFARTLLVKGEVERRAKRRVWRGVDRRGAAHLRIVGVRAVGGAGALGARAGGRCAVAGRRSHAHGTEDRRTGDGGTHESSGGGRAVREPQDGRGQPVACLPQAGDRLARGPARHARSRRRETPVHHRRRVPPAPHRVRSLIPKGRPVSTVAPGGRTVRPRGGAR